MHKKTVQIMQNLGYTQEFIQTLEKEIIDGNNKKALMILKDLGTPDSALDQIKNFELKPTVKISKNISNKELIESLIKKCRRSLDAFARKGIPARIVFKNKTWVIEAESLHPAIKKLHSVCRNYFDAWAAKGISVTFAFDASPNWIIMTKKKSDQPDL